MGDRSWFLEQEKLNRYSQYDFTDNPLANESQFKPYYGKLLAAKERPKPTFAGPYQSPKE